MRAHLLHLDAQQPITSPAPEEYQAGSMQTIFPVSGLKTFLSKPYFSCSSCWWLCFLSRGQGARCKNVTTVLLLLSIRNIHSIWIQWTHGYFLPSRLVPMWPRHSRLIGEEFIIFLPMTAKQMELFQKFSNCFQQHIVCLGMLDLLPPHPLS